MYIASRSKEPIKCNQFIDNYPSSIYNNNAKEIHTNTLETIEKLKQNKNEI